MVVCPEGVQGVKEWTCPVGAMWAPKEVIVIFKGIGAVRAIGQIMMGKVLFEFSEGQPVMDKLGKEVSCREICTENRTVYVPTADKFNLAARTTTSEQNHSQKRSNCFSEK